MSYDKSPKQSQNIGLTCDELEEITTILNKFPQISSAILFGSRAKGSYKKGSDVDIALVGENLDTVITKISYQLNEESTLPYYFDFIDYKTITNIDLKDHIDRVGITFFSKNN